MIMKGNSLVSVIVPTFNRARFLREALGSISNQIIENMELIVVDDGSTDDTEKVVLEFPKLVYYRLKKNRGVSLARNFGVAKASGRYLCFLDSDDIWEFDKLSTQLEWMESNPNSRVCYTDETWIRNGKKINQKVKHCKFSGEIFKHCLPLCIVSPSSVMIREDFFKEVGGFDETFPVCEDYDLWLRMALLAPFHFIDRKLIVKRGGHEDQLSRKYWGMDRFRVRALQKILADKRLLGENRKLAASILVEKCEILRKGFIKRDKTQEAEYYKNLSQNYQTDFFPFGEWTE